MYKLVLLRHGESEWNKLSLFTGWSNVDLIQILDKGKQIAESVFERHQLGTK